MAKLKPIEVWKEDTGSKENSEQKEKQELERQSSWCSLYVIGRIFGLILLLVVLILIVLYATGSFDSKMPSQVVPYVSSSTISSTPRFQKMYPKPTEITVL